MSIEVVFINNSEKAFAEALMIRHRVFVEEQRVPVELEHDEFDAGAVHVVVYQQGRAVGTGRFFGDPVDKTVARLGRVAVLPESRGNGLGSLIIKKLIQAVRKENCFKCIVIHAQKAVVGLYAGLGFRSEGAEFLEAGIVHQEMVLDC